MQGRITILSDNLVFGKGEGLGEHGFAAYLETDSGCFLFDTGTGETLVHNAAVYGKDLRNIDKILISHGHLDHTGGLPAVLRLQESIPVLGHPDMLLQRFRKHGERLVYNGIPYTKGYLEGLGARFEFNIGALELTRDAYLTGEIPRKTVFEEGDIENRFAEREGLVVPEIVADDQALFIRSSKGLVVLLGCAHAGMMNTLNHIQGLAPSEQIYAVIGGTHLGFSGQEQLERSLEALKEVSLPLLVPSHCTGPSAAAALGRALGEAVQFSHVGLSIAF